MGEGWKVHKMKSSFDNHITAIDDFFDQWDPSTVTSIEEVCGPQGGLCWKIKK